MTVGELIKELENFDSDRLVVLSKDQEGNGFSHYLSFSEYAYDRDEWEIGLECLTPELEEQGYSDEDVIDGEPCVVIWP